LKVVRVTIANFRGISFATILLPSHAVLIGDNNTGKTTILEALDLALGPDRLSRTPPVNEHDFFQGNTSPTPTTTRPATDRALHPPTKLQMRIALEPCKLASNHRQPRNPKRYGSRLK
jgi:putative ATP-dependent endonuclease of the OLD family